MSVSDELLCSFELLKPLDSSALKNHIKKGRSKRQSMLNSPVRVVASLGVFEANSVIACDCVGSELLTGKRCGGGDSTILKRDDTTTRHAHESLDERREQCPGTVEHGLQTALPSAGDENRVHVVRDQVWRWWLRAAEIRGSGRYLRMCITILFHFLCGA